MTTAALVLAGGRSSRMGSPKPTVKLRDGRIMLAHVLAAIAPLGLRIHLSVGKDHAIPAEWASLPVIWDDEEYPGPLVAIVQALSVIKTDSLLVICCDQPMLQANLLRRLVDRAGDKPAFFRDDQGRKITPFPGLFPSTLLPVMAAALNGGERSPRRFIESQACSWIDISIDEAATLASFNTMEELKRIGLLPEVAAS